MKKSCDGCGKSSKVAGKLFRAGYLTLCKECRAKKRPVKK